MSINALLTDARQNLRTGAGSSRDERLYIDPRQKTYPDIARDTRNYIDRGDCESASRPAVRGEIGTVANGTAVISTDEAHSGSSSFKVTKTTTEASGTLAIHYFNDDTVSTNMHGFLPGETIEHLAWVKIPSTGGPLASEVGIRIRAYYSAAWNIIATSTATVQDAWEKITLRVQIPEAATGLLVEVRSDEDADINEYFYFDDIEVHRYATLELAREDNLIDRGNCESTTLPGILGETGINANYTSVARSDEQSRSGTYSMKAITPGGVNAYWYVMDNALTTDMHGVVPGETIEFESYVYIPSTGGPLASKIRLVARYYDSGAWTSVAVDATTQDDWERLAVSMAVPTTATGFGLRWRCDTAAGAGEYYYVDDIVAKRHSVPGTHKLTGGYTEHLVTLPDTGTIQVKFHPNFAFDKGGNDYLISWYISTTQRLALYFAGGTTNFRVFWYDGGAVRTMSSAQYDDGTAERNINQWLTMTFAFDLTTGGTSGASLWMNKIQDDTTWSGNIDARTTVFNKMQIRNYASSAPDDYDIAFIRMFPDYVASDSDVQNDFKDVLAEEIYWSFDGHATGRTRCNVTNAWVRQMSLNRQQRSPLSGAYGPNSLQVTLNNGSGNFSDDQNGTYDPEVGNYNGSTAENFLRNQIGVELEYWHDGDFDHVFVGRASPGGLRRDSTRKNVSWVSLFAEDMAATIAKVKISEGDAFEDCLIVDTVESNSLLHKFARLGRPKIRQYLANNSFEDATIAASWSNTGGTFTRQANPLFGTYCGRLVPGAGAEAAYQTVEFLGTERLSVGQVFRGSVWVLSAGSVSGSANFIWVQERDGSGANDQTAYEYALTGGEGWVEIGISHVITDSDSDRVRLLVQAQAGSTVDLDGAMLVSGNRPANLFRESSLVLNEAAGSGAVSADFADQVSFDVFGFDVGKANYVHPWRRANIGETAWEQCQSIFDAIIVDDGSFSECGTLKAHGYMEEGRSEPIAVHTFDGTGTDYIRNKISIGINPLAANRIIGHGIKIVKHGRTIVRESGNITLDVGSQILWQASATNNFSEELQGLILSVPVADGAYFPDLEEYPVYWARLGTTEEKNELFKKLWNERKAGTLAPDLATMVFAIAKFEGITGVGTQLQYYGGGFNAPGGILDIQFQYSPQGPEMKLAGGEVLVGVTDADLLHKLADSFAPDANSELTEVSDWRFTSGLDVISRPGEVGILLLNDTGADKVVVDAGVIGRPVTMFSDDYGYTNDGYRLDDDISRNGEKVLEFGSVDILGDVREADDSDNPTHLDKVTEYWKDYCFTRRHVYNFAQHGSRYWVSPGQWGHMDLGAEGEAEYLNSKAVVASVKTTRTPEGIGQTLITTAEVKEGWKSSLNRTNAAFWASGVRSRSRTNTLTVASRYYIGATDMRCSGTNDEETINAAIAVASGQYGGGTVVLTPGTFTLGAAVDYESGVVLRGSGPQTIVKKNADDYAVKSIGISGTEITDIELRDMTITKDASDTSSKQLVYFQYSDNVILDNVTIDGSKIEGAFFQYCDDVSVINSRIINNGTSTTADQGVEFENCTAFKCTNNYFADNASADVLVDTTTGTSYDGLIANNYMTGSGYGIYIDDASNIRVVANKIIDASSTGVRINYSGSIPKDILISGNEISGSSTGYGISAFYGFEDIVIVDNIIKGVNNDGIILIPTSPNGKRAIVNGNTIIDCGDDGIYLNNDMVEISVRNNNVNGCTGNGIIVDDQITYGGINNNTVVGCGQVGISFAGTAGAVCENTVSDNTGIGISIHEPSGKTTDHSSVNGNTVNGNGGVGIVIGSGCSNISVTGNNSDGNNGGTLGTVADEFSDSGTDTVVY